MRHASGRFLFFSVVAIALFAQGQDSPSLGDVARQAKEQKQKQDSKPAKVITNEEIPERPQSAHMNSPGRSRTPGMVSDSQIEAMAKVWKSQIQGQKNLLSSEQSQIDKLNDSVHYAPGNCVRDCVQWNERQQQKQETVERMRAQLEEQKKHLEEMQEAARKQGYGSSIYDP
jgi:hypothetical protein